jgi:predicted dehydrogenase
MSPRRARAREIGVGILGFGFMGRTHLAAYRAAAEAGFPNRVRAVCDPALARRGKRALRRGNLEADGVRASLSGLERHAELETFLADASIELASVCTPTDTHVPLALAALRAGKHVLVEKPVALRASDVARLESAAEAARRVCMPAMCMRFWPGWDWLARAVADGTHGRVRSAVFRRLGSRPGWSRGFYDDPERSGGALCDLHVHDADFVRWCFGAPDSVASAGSLDHVTTLYRFARGPAHVVAEGGWDHAAGFPFQMGFTVVFERATAEYALGRDPTLTLARDGKVAAVPIAAETGYDGEVRHVLAVLAGRARPRVTLGESVELARMLAAERRSLERGRPVALASARPR